MKRWIILALVIALALSVMAVPAFAAELRGNFVDADNDGVCDNMGSYGCGMGQGANFVDADNDGVCDNMGTYGGRGQGRGCGMRQGGNFVDADNDGVCDNMVAYGCGRARCGRAG